MPGTSGRINFTLALLIFLWAARSLLILVYVDPYALDALGQYIPLAQNLWDGHGYSMAVAPPYEPTAIRLPGYPLFLLLTYCPWPHHPYIAILVQLLLEGVCIALIYEMTHRISGRRSAACLAALLYIFYPFNIDYVGSMWREGLFIPFCLGAAYLFYRALDKNDAKNMRYFYACLAITAASIYFREDGLYYFLIFVLIWLFKGRQNRRRQASTAITALIILAVILSPWILRNAFTFRKVIPISTTSAAPMWVFGNIETDTTPPIADSGYKWPTILEPFRSHGWLPLIDPQDRVTIAQAKAEWEYGFYTSATPQDMEGAQRTLSALARKYLVNDPFLYGWNTIKRSLHYALSTRLGELPGSIQSKAFIQSHVIKIASLLWHVLLICFGLWGLARKPQTRCLILPLVFSSLMIGALGWPVHRYVFPFFPLLFVGTVITLGELAHCDHSKTTTK